MELRLKDQKIRDIVIFRYYVIPEDVDVGRHLVTIKVTEEQVVDKDLDVPTMEEELEVLLDREVKVEVV